MRRALAVTALVIAIAAMTAAPAGADSEPAPEALNFPGEQVGTTSDSKLVHVHVTCDFFVLGTCGDPGTFAANPVFSGAHPGDFAQVNDCGAGIADEEIFDFCTFLITFKPTAAGSRTATLTVGTGGFPVPTDRTVALSGTATPVPVVTPDPPATQPIPATPSGAKKKCKKKGKKAGVAAKKCKTKKTTR